MHCTPPPWMRQPRSNPHSSSQRDHGNHHSSRPPRPWSLMCARIPGEFEAWPCGRRHQPATGPPGRRLRAGLARQSHAPCAVLPVGCTPGMAGRYRQQGYQQVANGGSVGSVALQLKVPYAAAEAPPPWSAFPSFHFSTPQGTAMKPLTTWSPPPKPGPRKSPWTRPSRPSVKPTC